jgi:hypothetical protein
VCVPHVGWFVFFLPRPKDRHRGTNTGERPAKKGEVEGREVHLESLRGIYTDNDH